jgi:sugar phosphate isomerase/epimerase
MSLKKSLGEITYKKYLENMPLTYTFKNGATTRCLICSAPDDFSNVIDNIDGIVLDVCHAYLATEKGSNETIYQFIDDFGQAIKYLHVSDAKAPNQQGLQIGDGDVSFKEVFEKLNATKKLKTDMVPEIANGHVNDGEGFRIALERLRRFIS